MATRLCPKNPLLHAISHSEYEFKKQMGLGTKCYESNISTGRQILQSVDYVTYSVRKLPSLEAAISPKTREQKQSPERSFHFFVSAFYYFFFSLYSIKKKHEFEIYLDLTVFSKSKDLSSFISVKRERIKQKK